MRNHLVMVAMTKLPRGPGSILVDIIETSFEI